MTYLDADALVDAHQARIVPGRMFTFDFSCTCGASAGGFGDQEDARAFERTHLIMAGVRAMEHTSTWAALLEERNTWARQMADLRDELDTAREERQRATEAKRVAESERDALAARRATREEVRHESAHH